MSENENLNDKEALLGDAASKPLLKRISTWVILLILIALGFFGFRYWDSQESSKVSYVTEKVERGNLNVTVSANGTINPVRTVSIGSELSGIVKNVLVDVNDSVAKGQVLIELDDVKLTAAAERAKATLLLSKAALAEAQATLQESQTKLKRLNEVRKLSGGKSPSLTEIEAQEALVARSDAAVQSAEAQITDSEEALKSAETDLSKTKIISPIDGIVLARSAEPGLAVAASLQAVELLSLATDMKKLELQINVDEADVGAVKPGQKAYFTVSAYPDRRFPAEITKVAFGSTTTDNVVTYVTYLDVNNEDFSLRPGMTATAVIQTAAVKDALLVPNTALRFKPAADAAPAGSSFMSFGPPHRNQPPKKAGTAAGASAYNKPGTVYVLKDGEPVAVPLIVGYSDGKMTQVVEGDLKEGDEVIVDQKRGSKG